MRWKRFDRWLWAGLVFVSLEAQGAMDVESECALSADSMLLTVDELFRLGVDNSLKLQADALDEAGLSAATYPDTPDWSQNYAIDFTQPLYEGGRIRYTIRKADLEKRVAQLRTATDRADVKLSLLEQYMSLFSLYKQREVLMRNIEESELRLKDIRQMKKEGLITNNDVLRSEMQLTNDRLSLTETENRLEPYDAYVAEAFDNDPAMKLLRKQTEQAKNEVRLAKAESLPHVSLYASNTLARPVSRTMADLYNNNWNIGLSVSYLSAFFVV